MGRDRVYMVYHGGIYRTAALTLSDDGGRLHQQAAVEYFKNLVTSLHFVEQLFADNPGDELLNAVIIPYVWGQMTFFREVLAVMFQDDFNIDRMNLILIL